MLAFKLSTNFSVCVWTSITLEGKYVTWKNGIKLLAAFVRCLAPKESWESKAV